MYKITLPINLDGIRYGMTFFKGIGRTDNEKIIARMREKGFNVESISEEEVGQENIPAPDPKNGLVPDYDSMTEEELAALAIEKEINIEDMTRRKVISALKKVM